MRPVACACASVLLMQRRPRRRQLWLLWLLQLPRVLWLRLPLLLPPLLLLPAAAAAAAAAAELLLLC
jgi:hypothetical protein